MILFEISVLTHCKTGGFNRWKSCEVCGKRTSYPLFINGESLKSLLGCPKKRISPRLYWLKWKRERSQCKAGTVVPLLCVKQYASVRNDASGTISLTSQTTVDKKTNLQTFLDGDAIEDNDIFETSI